MKHGHMNVKFSKLFRYVANIQFHTYFISHVLVHNQPFIVHKFFSLLLVPEHFNNTFLASFSAVCVLKQRIL